MSTKLLEFRHCAENRLLNLQDYMKELLLSVWLVSLNVQFVFWEDALYQIYNCLGQSPVLLLIFYRN